VILDGSTLVVWNQPRVLAKLGLPGGGSVPATRLISTTGPLVGGGDLSADRVPAATGAVDGYLTAAAFTAFSAKESPLTFGLPLVRTVNNVAMPAATAIADGYLTSASFAAFTAKVSASRLINTTAPITGGGDLSSDRTFAMAKSTAAVDGYLAATDFTTFAAKESALTFTAPLVRTVNTVAPDFTVQWTWTANGIAATPTDRLQLSNTTAAVAGTQQYSPALRFTGQGWGTTAGTSQAVDFRIYNQAVQGTTPTGSLLFDMSINGAAFATRYTFTSTGNFTATGTINGTAITGSSNLQCGASSVLGCSSRSRFSSASDGVILLSNNALNDLNRVQYGGTSASFPAHVRSGTTIKCRLADDSADAGFTSANFISSTVGVGFNGSAAVGKSAAYTFSNQTALRTINVSTATLTDALNCLAAIVADLKTVGLFA
jgi:hypothetical protein